MEISNISALPDNLSLCVFLIATGFNVKQLLLPLQFWFDLNSMSDEEWFILTDELIDVMGFKSSTSNKRHDRCHLIKHIRSKFNDGTDYMISRQRMKRQGHGGAQYKNEIRMKKRPFKKMLLSIRTSNSELIYDDLLAIEEGCKNYILYQRECDLRRIIEDNSAKRQRIEASSPPDIDLSCFPDVPVHSYDRMCVLYLVYLRQYHALKFGISTNIVDRIQQHCRTLGDGQGDVKLVKLFRTDHASVIESSLKQCSMMNGWKKEDMYVNGTLQTEVIDMNKTTIQSVINVVERFGKEHDKLTKEREDSIVNGSSDMEKFRIEKELESKRLDIERCRIESELKRIELIVELKRIELELKRPDLMRLNFK